MRIKLKKRLPKIIKSCASAQDTLEKSDSSPASTNKLVSGGAPLQISSRYISTERPQTLNITGQNSSKKTEEAEPKYQSVEYSVVPQSSSPYVTLSQPAISIDSIGSCSLDVNATGTTSPTTMETINYSQHSIRSISLENNLGSCRDERTTPLRSILKSPPVTTPIKDEVDMNVAVDRSAPSYFSISCALSGYSRLNRYDSSFRGELRSRENSPARFAFTRSRDSSPLRPEWKAYTLDKKSSPLATAAKIHELKEQLARCAKELGGQIERGRVGSVRRKDTANSTKRSISVDRGYLSSAPLNGYASDSKTGFCNGSVKELRSGSSLDETVARVSSPYEIDRKDSKSFIQQRIERLYGPGALAAGFKRNPALPEKIDSPVRGSHDISTHDIESHTPEGLPSVFRHLRPEFRYQLPVRVKKLTCSDSLQSKESSGVFSCSDVPVLPKDLASVVDVTDRTLSSDDRDTQSEMTLFQASDNIVKSTFKSGEEKRDGHYFIMVVEGEVKRMEAAVFELEKDLDEQGTLMSEEVRGKIFAAVGKTKLLLSQKVVQFKGLCYKNIKCSPDDEFPTTVEDLAGFWDMLSIQVEDVNFFINEIKSLKENNWQLKSPPKNEQPRSSGKKPPMPRGAKSCKGEKSKEDRAKEDARKRIAEERRKAMKESMKARKTQAEAQADVEIFAPERK